MTLPAGKWRAGWRLIRKLKGQVLPWKHSELGVVGKECFHSWRIQNIHAHIQSWNFWFKRFGMGMGMGGAQVSIFWKSCLVIPSQPAKVESHWPQVTQQKVVPCNPHRVLTEGSWGTPMPLLLVSRLVHQALVILRAFHLVAVSWRVIKNLNVKGAQMFNCQKI